MSAWPIIAGLLECVLCLFLFFYDTIQLIQAKTWQDTFFLLKLLNYIAPKLHFRRMIHRLHIISVSFSEVDTPVLNVSRPGTNTCPIGTYFVSISKRDNMGENPLFAGST